MDPYTLTSIVLTLAALIAYINHRYIKMQATIAIMAGSLLLSLILIILQHTGLTNIADQTKEIVIHTNFHRLLLNGMLSFLLFAGSLTIDFNTLKSRLWEIGTLATISTIASTVIVGILTFYLLPLLNLHLPLLFCLLFGALISPTDPIAVLATFKEIAAPKNLETCVAGESLFNDGVAIVIFLTLYQLTFNNVPVTFNNVTILFLEQAVGGLAYGIVLGVLSNWLIQKSKDHKISILITLALVTGGYNFALAIHISGPLAMVVAGIFIGNKARKGSAQDKIREVLDTFWEVIDEVLNAVLFLLIGFELLAINATITQMYAAVFAIPLVLFIRLITVAIPMKLVQLKRWRDPYAIAILTWGGLRGALAVALALSLPPSHYRDFILTLTYSVVAFAVIVQGLTIKPLVKRAKNA